MSRLRTMVAVGSVAAIAGAGGAWAGVAASAPSSSGVSRTGSSTATALAPIVQTTLTAQSAVPGTIGYDGAITVVLPGGTLPAAVAQARQKVTVDTLAVSAAETARADTAAAAAQSVSQAQAGVIAAQAAVAADQARPEQDPSTVATLTHDQATLAQASTAMGAAAQHAAQTEHQADAQLATANAALVDDRAALTQAERSALNPGTTFTAVPAAGQVVAQGQPLYALDGRPVPLLYGTTTAWRAFSAGMTDGPDVAELNAALTALGFGATPSSGAHFSNTTAAAVSRLQGSLGLPKLGALALGDVVFAPGPLAVSSVAVHPGSPAQPGTAVLNVTSTALVVTAPIPLTDVGTVKAGAAVTIDLPDGHNGIGGRVRALGLSVTGGSANNGNAQQGNNGGNGQGGNGGTTVNATVTFSDPSVATGLDQGPVLVHITTATAPDVLAVPVDALLALGGGGEGVEVVSNGAHRVVSVQVGLFTGTQVEIHGPGLAAGTNVVVPAS